MRSVGSCTLSVTVSVWLWLSCMPPWLLLDGQRRERGAFSTVVPSAGERVGGCNRALTAV
jgi:hypothetical protein